LVGAKPYIFFLYMTEEGNAKIIKIMLCSVCFKIFNLSAVFKMSCVTSAYHTDVSQVYSCSLTVDSLNTLRGTVENIIFIYNVYVYGMPGGEG
jgi:hypothetical protein